MRKIADLPKDLPTCRHPEHDPPTMIVLEPGLYEHECPGCGAKQYITVAQKEWFSTTDTRDVRLGCSIVGTR